MEHSDRSVYVTDQVASWIVNDSEYYYQAQELARARPGALALLLKGIIQAAKPFQAPWHVGQVLSPGDYDEVDWDEVARQLLAT